MLTAKSLVVFRAIKMNHKLLARETDAVCSHADPHRAFQGTPIPETAPYTWVFPTFLTSSHTVYSVKQLNCSLFPNMQLLCIPGPHYKQPTSSPTWHSNLLCKTGMLLLFQWSGVRRLLYLWMKLLFCASVAVLAGVSIFTLTGISPLIPVFHTGTRRRSVKIR